MCGRPRSAQLRVIRPPLKLPALSTCTGATVRVVPEGHAARGAHGRGRVAGGGGGGSAAAAAASQQPASSPILYLPLTRFMQVEKGVCEREFLQLRSCWARAFRAALARSK